MRLEATEVKEKRWARSTGAGRLDSYEELAGCFGPSILFLFPSSKDQLATLTFLNDHNVPGLLMATLLSSFGWLSLTSVA